MVHPANLRRPKGHEKFDDMKRVLALPVDPGLSPEEFESLNDMYCQEKAVREGFKLFNVQAHALISIFENDGGFMPIGVGWGKTLICLKTAADFIEFKGAEKVMIFVPPEVAGQLIKRDLNWLRQKVKLHGMPVFSFAGKGPKKRKALALSGKRGCYVLPYSLLSVPDTEFLLSTVNADVLILDEAHKVKRPNAARTRRLRDHIHKTSPKVVALSGTITNKSLLDYHHMLTAALGDIAPIPLTQTRAVDWACVLDANVQPDPEECEALLPLLDWAVENFPDETFEGDRRAFRTAYKLRMRSSPGVVATGDEEIGTSLCSVNHEVKSASEKLKELVKGVEEDWITPSGDDIDFAIHKNSWLRQLSAGFYYERYWPEGVDPEILQRSKDYLDIQNDYHKEVRDWLKYRARTKLDTPMLLGAEMARTQGSVVGEDLYNAWQDLRDADFKGRIDRSKRAVRVCSAKIEFAKRWAGQMKHGIIWVYHQEVGTWLHDLIPDAVFCPAGNAANEAIAQSKGRIVIASYSAHGTGKNLQFHENQLFLQFPREAHIMEQLQGRLHRNGQKADELICHTMLSTDYDHMAFAAMLNDSLYIHQTGAKQKSIISGYSPTPKIFPPEVLIERGFHDIKTLSTEDQRLFSELFSDSTEI